jgi:carbon-monoxide dehydrogenase medium subunit
MTFEYVEPEDLDEASAALGADEDAVALAGGTAFTLLFRQGLIRPGRVVGLRRLAALRGISARNGGLRIGALATHREIEASSHVRALQPALAAAFAAIATIRIRNQATIGGNLAHADPSQDPPPILVALGATIEIAGPAGARRSVPVESFFIDYLSTVLSPGELILAVAVPPATPKDRAVYRKFLPRSADDYATVSVAASVRLEADGRIAGCRVALGGAGPTPVRARRVEAAVMGRLPTAELLRDAADLVRDEIDPIDDARGSVRYKREMAAVWVRRVLTELVA